MISAECFINKTYTKISYPAKSMIELVHAGKKGPYELCTSEILPGEIIIFVTKNNEKYIYTIVNEELNQICGEHLNYYEETHAEVKHYKKAIRIKKYIIKLFNNLPLIDLISNKSDLETLEYQLTSYLLLCKNKNKFDLRRIRSIVFKSCKEVRMCEKIYSLISKIDFDDYDDSTQTLILNFANLSVQFNND